MTGKYKDREFNLCAREVFEALARGKSFEEVSDSMRFPQLSDEDQKRVCDVGYRLHLDVRAEKIHQANSWLKCGIGILAFDVLVLLMVDWPTAGYRSGQVALGIFLGIGFISFGLYKRVNLL